MTPSERAAMAEQERLAHTGGAASTPGEAPAMATQTDQPAPPTPPPAEPGERTPWWVWALIALVVAFLVGIGVFIAINRGADQPAPPVPQPTAVTTPTNAPTTAPTAEPTTLTEEETAYADAEEVYRDFAASFAEARTQWEAPKLDGSLITVDLAQFFVNDFERMRVTVEDGSTVRWTQDIQSVTPVRYATGEEVVIRVCAVTNTRFIAPDGTDVTQSGPEPDAPPAPINTTARAKDIPLAWDGEGWRLTTFIQASGEGEPC